VRELLNNSLAFLAELTSIAEVSDGLARLNGDPIVSRSAGLASLDTDVPVASLVSSLGDASVVTGVGDLFICVDGDGGARGSADA
jgi:hypothetical protein